MPRETGGRCAHRVAVDAGLDEPDAVLRLPLQLPKLVEGAQLATRSLGLTPGNPEQPQPVKQLAARPIRRVAQIQVLRRDRRRWEQLQAALLRLQVTLHGHTGRLRRHLAHHLADRQALADQPHGGRVALAEDGQRRLVQLGQPGHWKPAQRRQRLA